MLLKLKKAPNSKRNNNLKGVTPRNLSRFFSGRGWG
jgi:hypothetical protein